MSTEPMTGTFHDALTGETIVRDLTPEEAKAVSLMQSGFSIIEVTDETPSPD
jgi:hypothetical protein